MYYLDAPMDPLKKRYGSMGAGEIDHLGPIGSQIPFISVHRPSPTKSANKSSKNMHSLNVTVHGESRKYTLSGETSHANLDSLFNEILQG